MIRKLTGIIVLVLAVILAFSACTDTQNGKKDQGTTTDTSSVQQSAPVLIGDWKQTNSSSETSYQTAIINDTSIEVYWVNKEDDTKSLYWAGTFAPPTTADKKYSWDSKNDKEKTGIAILASNDDTKTFTYDNGELSYSVSALGTTQTVKLKKQ